MMQASLNCNAFMGQTIWLLNTFIKYIKFSKNVHLYKYYLLNIILKFEFYHKKNTISIDKQNEIFLNHDQCFFCCCNYFDFTDNKLVQLTMEIMFTKDLYS